MAHLPRTNSTAGALLLTGALVVATAATVAVAATIGDQRTTTAADRGDGSGGAAPADCMTGVVAPGAGEASLTLTNGSDATLQVWLTSADRVVTYGRVDGLVPGASRVLDVRLPPGGYVWTCAAPDGSRTISEPWTVSGSEAESARLRPVTADELDDAVATYRAAITGQLQDLGVAVDELVAATAAQDLQASRRAWLRGHLDYERMGAAYGTFGEYDAMINGRPTGLPDGVEDSDFTGFRLLEHQLWVTDPVPWDRAMEAATQLRADVEGLAAELPVLFTDPADLPLRAHEILENTLQFELNGLSDQGSHTELATIRANLDGTATVLTALAPALQPRQPELLAATTTDLDATTAFVDRYRSTDGSWTALDDLPLAERRRLNGMISQLVEDLAPVPGLLSLPTATS